MLALGLAIKAICAFWALGWTAYIAVSGKRSLLMVTFAVFSACMSGILIAESLGDHLGPWRDWVLILSGGTCSVFWLFSRTLFRQEPEIGVLELAIVAGIFAPAALKPIILTGGALLDIPVETLTGLTSALFRIQALLSSTVLMLTVWEAVRNWPSTDHKTEQALRYGFVAMFSSCVFICMILLGGPTAPTGVSVLMEGLCAASVLGFCTWALIYREHNHAPETRVQPAATDEDIILGQRVAQIVERECLHLDPDLTVADLARRLSESPNRVSRAITAGLNAPNFNRFINQRRINHAVTLLSDPAKNTSSILQIGYESGFNSIGPFNRAFKAQTGETPSAFRKMHNAPISDVMAE